MEESGSSEALSWSEASRLSLSFARQYARSCEDAEDLAQEALIRAWRHRSSLANPDAFSAWLRQIVRNEAARAHRRGRLLTVSLEKVSLPDVDDQSEVVAARADLERVLIKLNPREKRLVQLRYFDDLTQPAIARRLSVPEGTIKIQLHRARIKLRRALSDHER